MNERIVGLDVAAPITEELLELFTREVGQAPSWVGRYFTSKYTKGGVEYRRRTEDPVLAAHEIRVLPIARQTNHVGGANITGKLDGVANREDILATFGEEYLMSLGGRFRIALDVEGNGQSHLSTDYWRGWDSGLKGSGVELIPCIYGLPGDGRTWEALARAIKMGARCGGAWFARPRVRVEPVQWDPNDLKPYRSIEGVEELAVQYAFRGKYDASLLNPALADGSEFLSTLILPPGGAS